MPTEYSKWPVREKAREFYKEIVIGSNHVLVPSVKLGNGQIRRAESARREAALIILSDPAKLAAVRTAQRNELETNISAAKSFMEAASADVPADDTLSQKDRFMRVLVSLQAQTLLPETKEPTDADAEYYIGLHRRDSVLHGAWIAALYIPFPESMPIAELYDYIPYHVLEETQGFFNESYSEPEEPLQKTNELSTE